VTLDLDGQARDYSSLPQALEEFAWALLRVYHDGFENNEGGYGTIEIDGGKAQPVKPFLFSEASR